MKIKRRGGEDRSRRYTGWECSLGEIVVVTHSIGIDGSDTELVRAVGL